MNKFESLNEPYERIRQSEERLLALMKATSDVIYRMSPDWKTMSELYGRGFLEDTPDPDPEWLDKYIHPQDQAFVLSVVDECIRDKRTFELEHRVLRADGSVGWTFSRAIPLFEDNGDIKEWFGAASNITERKRMEEALHLHSSIAESLGEAIFAVDINQNVIFWNKGAETLYGWREEEAMGRNLTQLFTPIYYDGGVSREQAVKDSLEQGWWRGEASYKHKDGYVIDVMANGRVIKDKNGKIISMFIIHTDITERKKMEEALKESEIRFKTLSESTPIGVGFSTMDGILRYTNPAFERILGYERGEMVGKKATDMWWIDKDRKAWLDILKQKGNITDFQAKLRKKDGTAVWGSMGGASILFGSTPGVMGTIQDITKKREAEEALIASHRQIQSIIDNTPDIIYAIDQEKRFTLANTALAELHDTTPAQMIGKRRHEFMPKEDADGQENNDHQVIEQNRTLEFEENSHIKGRSLTWLSKKFPLHDAQDRIFGVAGISTDITERKQKADALSGSRKQLSELSESLAAEVDALSIFHKINTRFIKEDDAQLVYADIMDAAILLTDADCGNMQIVADDGNTLEIVAHKGYSDEFIRRYQTIADVSTICAQAKEQKSRIIVDDVSCGTIFDEDNRRFMLGEGMVCIQSTPMFSVAGKLLGIMSTHYKSPHVFDERQLRVLDLLSRQAANVIERIKIGEALHQSEKKALELVEVLKETDSNKNQFISALSHELRNPLAIISTGLEILGLTQSEEQIQKTNEILSRQMRQLCALVDDLLDLTRISNNRIELKKEVLELSSLVLSTAEEQRALFDEKGVGLHTRICDDPIYIDADTVRIKQIIGNLLHNAQKYTPAGGEVLLSVYRENKQAVISVKDNGMGLSPELIPRLFHPFVQADMTLDRSGGGLGLGLSITKGIAEMHGGSIAAYSGGLG